MRTALLLALTLITPLIAQGTRSDYERTRTLPRLWRSAAPTTAIAPRWWQGGKGLTWVVRDAAGTPRVVLVDAEKGTTRDAFDPEHLAAALGSRSARARVRAAQPREGKVVLWIGETFRLWDPSSRTLANLAEVPEEFVTEPIARGRSVRSSTRTAVLFRNETEKPVTLHWVPERGGLRAYGSIAPGGTNDMSTYVGHVFLVRDENGKDLGRWSGQPGPAIARITPELPRKERPRRRTPRRERSSSRHRVEVVDHDLVLVDTRRKERLQLTKDGEAGHGYGHVLASPDGRHFLARKTLDAAVAPLEFVDPAPEGTLRPKLERRPYRRPGDRMPQTRFVLVDARTKKVLPLDEQVTRDSWRISRLRFAASGKRATFLFNPRGHGHLTLYAIAIPSGKIKPLIEDDPDTFFDYANKTYCEFVDDDRGIIWMSERSGTNTLWFHDARTGRPKHRLTPDPWVVRRVLSIDREARILLVEVLGVHPQEDPYHVHVARCSFDGGDPVLLTEGDGTHSLEWAPDGKTYVDRWSRVDLAPRYALRSAVDGSLIATLPAEETNRLAEAGWRAPERHVAPGRDGRTTIHGIIHRPSNFDPSKRYPVIEQIYAGPHGAHVPKGFRAWHGAQGMAELGFVVVQIDGMGTNWRSKAFHDVCWKNLGDAGFPDRIAWMKDAARTRPWMDLSRVGIYGGSAGGQNAMRALIAHSDFYSVAAADCGCHDNRMDKIWWNELWMSWPLGPHYDESSNLKQAHRTKGDLLLVVGMLDTNVDPASTFAVADALVKADIDFDLLAIPSAGHGAMGTPYGRRRMQDFFVRKILGVEPRSAP